MCCRRRLTCLEFAHRSSLTASRSQEDYSKVKATALEAVKSKAFIYPVKVR